MKHLLFFLPVIFALCGCAVMQPTEPYPSGEPSGRPVFEEPAEEPAAHSGEKTLPPNTLPHRETLTLKAAIETALANNPEVAAARWDAEAAAARRDQAFGERLPGVGLVGAYTRTLDEERVIATSYEGEPGAFSRGLVAGDIVLSVPLFTGGRLISEQRAAKRHREASDHRADRSRKELVYEVSGLFFDILAQRHVIESLEFSKETLETHLKHTDERIAAQRAAIVDRLRTDVRLADVRQELTREKAMLRIQHRTLANLLGLSNKVERFYPVGELALSEKQAIPELEEALETAWINRDDYLAAKADLEAKARRVDAARAGHWPVVSLKGAYGGRRAVGSTRGPGDDYGDVGHIGIEMDMPLFEGGRIEAGVRERRAELAAARHRLRGFEHQVELEVEIAISDVNASATRVAAVEKAIDQARESLRIEKEKYGAGRGAVVDVLDAQGALLESEKTYYRAMAELRTAIARLELAMGDS